jgi:hypothetical protein
LLYLEIINSFSTFYPDLFFTVPINLIVFTIFEVWSADSPVKFDCRGMDLLTSLIAILSSIEAKEIIMMREKWLHIDLSKWGKFGENIRIGQHHYFGKVVRLLFFEKAWMKFMLEFDLFL